MNRKLYTLIGIAITSLGIVFSSCSDYLNVEKNFNRNKRFSQTEIIRCNGCLIVIAVYWVIMLK